MAINIEDLTMRLERVEREVVALREALRQQTATPVDLDRLSASIADHAVTDEDTTEILTELRREGKEWWKRW